MPVIPIGSLDDSRLDDYRNVPDPDLVTARGVFVAEGRLVVSRLLASPRFAARSLLVNPAALASLDDAHDALAPLPVYVVEQDLMDAVTGFNIHRGCLAIGERGAPLEWTEVARRPGPLLVLEHVGNADNVGGIFRNAAAFGAAGVLLGPACTDPLYRKA